MNPLFAIAIFWCAVWGGTCWLRADALKPLDRDEPEE